MLDLDIENIEQETDFSSLVKPIKVRVGRKSILHVPSCVKLLAVFADNFMVKNNVQINCT